MLRPSSWDYSTLLVPSRHEKETKPEEESYDNGGHCLLQIGIPVCAAFVGGIFILHRHLWSFL